MWYLWLALPGPLSHPATVMHLNYTEDRPLPLTLVHVYHVPLHAYYVPSLYSFYLSRAPVSH